MKFILIYSTLDRAPLLCVALVDGHMESFSIYSMLLEHKLHTWKQTSRQLYDLS